MLSTWPKLKAPPKKLMMGVCGSGDADQMLFIPTRQECLHGLSQPINLQGVDIKDKMRFMNGDNPSVEFEDGTQKGGHRQVFVLKAVQQLNADLKAWDTSFLMENERLPNSSDYSRSEESRGILHKRKVALKLLESWKISVHL